MAARIMMETKNQKINSLINTTVCFKVNMNARREDVRSFWDRFHKAILDFKLKFGPENQTPRLTGLRFCVTMVTTSNNQLRYKQPNERENGSQFAVC